MSIELYTTIYFMFCEKLRIPGCELTIKHSFRCFKEEFEDYKIDTEIFAYLYYQAIKSNDLFGEKYYNDHVVNLTIAYNLTNDEAKSAMKKIKEIIKLHEKKQ